MKFSSFAVATVLAQALVQAHPGHNVRKEVEQRAEAMKNMPRNLDHCAEKLKARGHTQRNIDRRAAVLKAEREKRGLASGTHMIKARDVDTVLNTDHESPEAYTPDTPLETVFSGNNSCILSPDVTEGPYYVSGEYVRADIREADKGYLGLDLILDIQVLDIVTCEPVPKLMMDLWSANTTGVYSGVVSNGNGNDEDQSNLDTTHSRGLQETDDFGVAQFTAFFPGHYSGRTTHYHVATHVDGVTHANGTYSGLTVSHVGQMFFDQSLISEVSATEYYAPNTQPVTLNADDMILSESAAGDSDPVINYSLLGENIEDGIFGWIAFGIDTAAASEIRNAATLTESGGVTNPNAGGGPGGPPPPARNGSTVSNSTSS